MPSSTTLHTAVPQITAQTQDEENDEGQDDRLDLGTLQSFADKVQRRPTDDDDFDVTGESSRTKIIIPKRGEKDFEPMQETVNLQEMMLQRSREALFGALAGVRGGSSKAMSHALLDPSSQYPRVIVARGHLLDSMGIAIRHYSQFVAQPRTYTELLPEEALYLLERGSLQLWLGPLAVSPEDEANGIGEWSDEEYGIRGAVEMSVMEGFATFIGQDNLSWERYQSYAYLKRLGYTVQRTRRFLPARFHHKDSRPTRHADDAPSLPPFQTWWRSIPSWTSLLLRALSRRIANLGFIASTLRSTVFAGLSSAQIGCYQWSLSRPSIKSYHFISQSLRVIPSSHALPRPHSAPPVDLEDNPYLPFWHVWKPATPWSKGSWDRASPEGLQSQRPEYIAAVINARDTPMPSLTQLSQVFDELPDEPKGPVKKVGPQYQRPESRFKRKDQTTSTTLGLSFDWLRRLYAGSPHVPVAPNMGSLRNGDRALIVAVNDSGNTGWVRFGRTGFAEQAAL